ncbi:hypothetical protein [Fusobacterium ulcerans]|uniref:hypothetical protein n=1 Tax=Fusobacterium ulcerans TaxID=861 RepID=UPI003FF0EB65
MIKSKFIKETDIVSSKPEGRPNLKKLNGNIIVELFDSMINFKEYQEYFLNRDKTFISCKLNLLNEGSLNCRTIAKEYFYSTSKESLKFSYMEADQITNPHFTTPDYEMYFSDKEFILNFVVDNSVFI